MSLKYIKRIFICIILVLILSSIYIVYIKGNKAQNGVQAQTRETKISNEINVGISEFDTINPILTKSIEIQEIDKLIYEPLIDLNLDFSTKPAIAEEWSKLDELTYLIKLSETKTWQNGEKITVEDIEQTVKTIKETDSIYKENIKQIEKIEKINESTFKIHLSEKVDFFEYMLCFPIIKENTETPMGTGKYQVVHQDPQNIILKGEKQTLNIKIYKTVAELYNAFTREKVDLIITQNTNYEKYIGTIGFDETTITGREFYYISCENIKDIETKKTIEQAINKEKLVYDLYNNKYKVASFPLEYGSYLNYKKETNAEGTKPKKKTLTLSINKEDLEIAKSIQEQLKENEITVNIQNYKNPKADLILKKETVPITPEISRYFEDEETKSKIDKIVKIENKEVLKQEYENIIKEYYETKPFISLYFSTYIILHTRNLKGDFTGNWYNFFYNIDTWYKVIWNSTKLSKKLFTKFKLIYIISIAIFLKIGDVLVVGDINVFTGPMKCGKTQKILDEAQRQQIAGKDVKVFKPKLDDRFSTQEVVSRKGYKLGAIEINNVDEIKKYDADVYVIDEFQFLNGDVAGINELAKNGKKFFISGLNLTSERKPFGKMGDLLCMADNVQMLTAVCENCHSDNAIYTYFKGGNKTGDVLVGDNCYMPLCRKCYEKLINEKK